jgi:predicted CopG family antitoxin
MPTRTISITDEAYQKLKSLKGSEKESFSDVILKYYPARKRLSLSWLRSVSTEI